ncbi:MAG: 5'-nucleotidase [Gammaproteobacteria bacterium]|nr:5'-nucleotidase [Gammaproteobacteria bacterium]
MTEDAALPPVAPIARGSIRPLTVAISSRALFDLEASHRVFVDQGLEAYADYQVAHEDEILEPGVAFPLVEKLLHLNADDKRRVNVILLSHNSADTGLRIFRAIDHHGLDISQAAFTNGRSPYHYVTPFDADLFLSADPQDVTRALDSLSPGQRSVVSAISVEGRSISETARHLGMSETAVRVSLHRGLGAIAKRFGRS